jgi:hypothetical protein
MPTIRIKSILHPDDLALSDVVGKPMSGLVAVVEVVIGGVRSDFLVPFEGQAGPTWDSWAAALAATRDAIDQLGQETVKWTDDRP